MPSSKPSSFTRCASATSAQRDSGRSRSTRTNMECPVTQTRPSMKISLLALATAFVTGLVAAPALALGVLACVDGTRHARRPSLRLALVATALVTAVKVEPLLAIAAAAAGVAASLSREWCPLGLACAAACFRSGAGVLAALAADSATDPISFLLAGAAAALTAMTWATRLGSLAGAPLAVAAMASVSAASTAAWLAEDLRGAADASTPGWAAVKRFLGPPDGEVVLRDGRIVKRTTVVDV